MKKGICYQWRKRTSYLLSVLLLLFCTAAALPLSAQTPTDTGTDTLYEDVPDIPQQDIDSVMVWIKSRVAIMKTPYCWKNSYGRGAGVVRSVCADGLENSNALCYPKCNNGFTGNGPVCWQNCPGGYTDDGAFCGKTTTYGRGAGRTPDKKSCSDWDPAYRDDGTSCWLDAYGRGGGRVPDKKPCSAFNAAYRDDGTSCWMDSYGRGSGYVAWNEDKCKRENPSTGCEKYGAMWYPKCKAGYHNDGCCICGPNGGPGIKVTAMQRYQCRDDEELNGSLCYPKCRQGFAASGCCVCSPAAGAGIKVTAFLRYVCKADEELQGALCYPKCKTGFHADGCCICAQDCYPGSGTDIGVSCTKKSYGRGVGQVLLCPTSYIADETGGPVGLCYPRCNTTYNGVGPVCWQKCPNGMVECGAGCAKDALECASTTFDQVFSVAMLAINIATFGQSSAATPALKAGQSAVQVGSKVAVVGGRLAKVQRALWKTIDVLSNTATKVKNATLVQRVIKFYDTNKEGIQAAKTIFKIAKLEYTISKDFQHSYAEDFATLTSDEINAQLDNNFDTLTAKYLKETWANMQMAEMAQTNGFVIAKDVLSAAAIVDPTGVVSVVNAFTKPICGADVPWPMLSRSYKQNGTASLNHSSIR